MNHFQSATFYQCDKTTEGRLPQERDPDSLVMDKATINY